MVRNTHLKKHIVFISKYFSAADLEKLLLQISSENKNIKDVCEKTVNIQLLQEAFPFPMFEDFEGRTKLHKEVIAAGYFKKGVKKLNTFLKEICDNFSSSDSEFYLGFNTIDNNIVVALEFHIKHGEFTTKVVSHKKDGACPESKNSPCECFKNIKRIIFFKIRNLYRRRIRTFSR